MQFPWLVLAALGTAALTAGAARVTRRPGFAALAGGGVLLWLHAWGFFYYTSDDAYISFRYARNLAEGLGLAWNAGDRVEGYSNFSWVMVLAAADRLGADIVPAARWLGFALAIGAMGGAYALSRRLVEGAPGAVAGMAAVLLLAGSGSFALWSSAGLETSLFAALVVAAVLLHTREADGARLPASGAVWALAALTRPDAPLLFAVSGVFKLAEASLRLRSGATRPRDEARSLGAWLVGFAAMFVPYFVWRYVTYDWLFPNTYYAKVGSGSDQFERGLHHLAIFTREYAMWLLLLAPIAAVLGAVRRGPALHAFVLLVVWFGYVVYVGGDALVRFRLLAPLLPIAYALIAASAAALLQGAARGLRPPRYALEAAMATAFVGLLLFTLQASSTDGTVAPEREAVKDRAEIGRWLRDNVPRTTTIAVIPAGAIPYESRLPAIDMLGINDEHIAHRDLPLGSFAAGHEKYDSAYVLDREPDIIIVVDDLEDAPRPREEHAGLLLGVILARIDLLTQPRLWQEYEARSVEIREGRWFNLLVRHDASGVLARTQSADAAAP